MSQLTMGGSNECPSMFADTSKLVQQPRLSNHLAGLRIMEQDGCVIS
jgi:hypothetical protein